MEFDYQTYLRENSLGPVEIHRGPEAREKRREAAIARLSQNNQLEDHGKARQLNPNLAARENDFDPS